MHKYQISRLIFALCVTICISLTTIAPAAIITTGDVDPGAPSGWTSSTTGYVGDDENGTMEITDGDDVTSRYGYIGHRPDSTSVVIIDGDGSAWVNSYSFYVGYFGNGTLEITDGGYVSNSTGYIGYYGYNSAGVVAVDGAGSKWVNSSDLYVGNHGSGTLNITNGGDVSNHSAYIGHYASSTSVVTVSGDDSKWVNSEHLYVGYYGEGTLSITGGGSVSNTGGRIGTGSGSTGVVTVDGAGSTWVSSSISIHVGSSGDGTLNITDGGSVSSLIGYIGNKSSSTGAVTVDGVDSIWTNSDYLYVGYEGNATLTITNGGLVSVADTLTIDYDEDGDSFINMSTGGMLALYGDASDSLTEFLALVSGTDAIRYWDSSSWADISGATNGVDYTLSAGDGELVGYTVLTVPEPATMSLLALGGLAMIKRRRRKR